MQNQYDIFDSYDELEDIVPSTHVGNKEDMWGRNGQWVTRWQVRRNWWKVNKR